METVTYHWETEDHEATFEVKGKVSAFYPAKIYGPPEACCPAEGGEVEIESVKLVEYHGSVDFTPEVKSELEKLFQTELDKEGTTRETIEEKMFEAAQSDPFVPPWDEY